MKARLCEIKYFRDLILIVALHLTYHFTRGLFRGEIDKRKSDYGANKITKGRKLKGAK